jgi:UDP-glucose 4-epimerase
MSILVTGGAGYIGSHMVWALVDRGEAVVVLDRLSTGFIWAVAPEAKLVVGDIADDELLDRVIAEHDVTAIVHFAGSIIVPESVADPLAYYLNNTVKSRALIASAVRNGVKSFVFSSTAAVYGDPGEAPVSEAADKRPLSPYGSSKLMTEIMLQDVAAAHDFDYAVLRYFNVAGADPRGRTGQSTAGATHLIKVACEAALGKREKLLVFGTDYDTPDGTAVRDYIHVTDLIDAHLRALDHLQGGNGSLTANVGYSKGYSVKQVLAAVERVVGRPLPVEHGPRRAGDSPRVVAATDHIRATLKWEPQWDDLDAIVRHALNWEEALKRRNQV